MEKSTPSLIELEEMIQEDGPKEKKWATLKSLCKTLQRTATLDAVDKCIYCMVWRDLYACVAAIREGMEQQETKDTATLKVL